MLLGKARCFRFRLHGLVKEFLFLTQQALYLGVWRRQLVGAFSAETLFAVFG
jgi:hypothetical protein